MGPQLVVLVVAERVRRQSQCPDPAEQEPSPVGAQWPPGEAVAVPVTTSPGCRPAARRGHERKEAHIAWWVTVLLSAQAHWAPGLIPVATELSICIPDARFHTKVPREPVLGLYSLGASA